MRAFQQVVQQFHSGDLLALERWVSAAPAGYLRTNGMGLLVWEYHRMGDNSRAQRWASDLLEVEPENPLALAILADNPERALTETSPHEAGADRALNMAKRALRGIDQMKPIEGMPESTFFNMKTELRHSLEGSVGYAYFQRNDYVTAREYLRRAVSASPTNAQLVYALAISDLYANPPDRLEGYQMLARAVNLSQGTPSGTELAEFAQKNFQQAGGTIADWNTYLANTRIAPSTTQNASATPPTTSQSPLAPNTTASGGTAAAVTAPAPASNQSGAQASSATTVAQPSSPAAPAPSSQATVTQPSSPASTAPSSEATAAQPSSPAAPAPSSQATVAPASPTQQAPAQPVEMARATPPGVTRPTTPPIPPRKIVPAGAPISLGILIETAATHSMNREAVVNSLADLVRRLRSSDEAFVMSYSKDLSFEQDLTDNAKALETAMDNIKPTSGTALYDAVAFASGHLKRIARNQKRVLIVISDGSNGTTRISPLELSGELNVSGVEIYCIGLGADTTANQYRLQALAQRTGGQTLLTYDPAQFRRATQQVAQSIGIPF